jgi:hypothetical protein
MKQSSLQREFIDGGGAPGGSERGGKDTRRKRRHGANGATNLTHKTETGTAEKGGRLMGTSNPPQPIKPSSLLFSSIAIFFSSIVAVAFFLNHFFFFYYYCFFFFWFVL